MVHSNHRQVRPEQTVISNSKRISSLDGVLLMGVRSLCYLFSSRARSLTPPRTRGGHASTPRSAAVRKKEVVYLLGVPTGTEKRAPAAVLRRGSPPAPTTSGPPRRDRPRGAWLTRPDTRACWQASKLSSAPPLSQRVDANKQHLQSTPRPVNNNKPAPASCARHGGAPAGRERRKRERANGEPRSALRVTAPVELPPAPF